MPALPVNATLPHFSGSRDGPAITSPPRCWPQTDGPPHLLHGAKLTATSRLPNRSTGVAAQQPQLAASGLEGTDDMDLDGFDGPDAAAAALFAHCRAAGRARSPVARGNRQTGAMRALAAGAAGFPAGRNGAASGCSSPRALSAAEQEAAAEAAALTLLEQLEVWRSRGAGPTSTSVAGAAPPLAQTWALCADRPATGGNIRAGDGAEALGDGSLGMDWGQLTGLEVDVADELGGGSGNDSDACAGSGSGSQITSSGIVAAGASMRPAEPAAALPAKFARGPADGLGSALDRLVAAELLELGDLGCSLLLEEAEDGPSVAQSGDGGSANDKFTQHEVGEEDAGGGGTRLQQQRKSGAGSAAGRCAARGSSGGEHGGEGAAALKAARQRREALCRRFINQALADGARRGRSGGLLELQRLMSSLSDLLAARTRAPGTVDGSTPHQLESMRCEQKGTAGPAHAAHALSLREVLGSICDRLPDSGAIGKGSAGVSATGASVVAAAPASGAAQEHGPAPQRVFVALLHLATQSNLAIAAGDEVAECSGLSAGARLRAPIRLVAGAGGDGGNAQVILVDG